MNILLAAQLPTFQSITGITGKPINNSCLTENNNTLISVTCPSVELTEPIHLVPVANETWNVAYSIDLRWAGPPQFSDELNLSIPQTYTLTQGEKLVTFIIKPPPPNGKRINIFIMKASLSFLYETLQFFSEQRPKTEITQFFIWRNTYNFTRFDEYIQDQFAEGSFVKYFKNYEVFPDWLDNLKELIYQNLGAEFHLYLEDIRTAWELSLLCSNGITNYHVHLGADGSLSYRVWTQYNLYHGLYGVFRNEYFQIKKDSFYGNLQGLGNADDMGLHQKLYASLNQDFPDGIKGSVDIILPDIDCLVSKDPLLMADKARWMEKNYLIKGDIREYRKLLIEKKIWDNFLWIADVDAKAFNEEFKPNGKPFLWLLTSYPLIAPDSTEAEYVAVFKYISDKYKDKYCIVIKPHPVGIPLPNSTFAAEMSKLGIQIYRAQTALEIFLLAFPDSKCGGFFSSSFYSCAPGDILFIFNFRNARELPDPCPMMPQFLYKDLEFISIKYFNSLKGWQIGVIAAACVIVVISVIVVVVVIIKKKKGKVVTTEADINAPIL